MKVYTTRLFDKELKKYAKKHYNVGIIKDIVDLIVADDKDTLRRVYKDHALKHNWKGYRELHIEGDWLLIYKVDHQELVLTLVRTGSHDDLF